MKSSSIFFFFLFIFTGLRPSYSNQNIFNDYLSFFGAGCSLNGPLTQESNRSVQAIIRTLEALQNDRDCQPLLHSISQMQLVRASIDEFQNFNSEEISILGLQNRNQELLEVLRDETIPNEERLELESELRQTQLSIAERLGRNQYLLSYNDQSLRRHALPQLLSTTNSLLHSIQSAQSCWLKYPSLLSEVGSLGTLLAQNYALGTTSSRSLPYSSAWISLGAQIISHFQNLKIEKKIRDFRKPLETTALYCTYETLSNQYCAARDAITTAKFVAKALETDVEDSELKSALKAIKVLDREVIQITEWLERVRAGNLPTNTGSAARRIEIEKKEEKLTSSLERAIGIIEENKKQFRLINDTDPQRLKLKQWQLMKQTITSIVSEVYPTSFSLNSDADLNPLLTVFSTRDLASYHLVGNKSPALTTTGEVKNFQQSFNPFGVDWNGEGPFVPNLEIIDIRFKDWFKQAKDAFDIQRNLVKIDDPFLIFAEGFPKNLVGPKKGLSKYESLKTIVNLLSDNSRNFYSSQTSNLNEIYTNTVSRLKEIIRIWDLVMTNKIDPTAALKLVGEQANLDNGADFLRNRLNFFIRTILENKIIALSEDAEKLIFLSSFDSIQTLQSISNTNSIENLIRDAENAQRTIQETLNLLTQLFTKEINKSLSDISSSSKNTQSEHGNSNKNLLVQFCFQIATTPLVPKNIDLNLCFNLVTDRIFKKGPEPITFDRSSINKNFLDRICTLRDHKRRIDVYQSLLSNDKYYNF